MATSCPTRRGLSRVVVNEGGQPIGMVTKLDRRVPRRAARKLIPLVADVMMPLAISLDESATVAGCSTGF